MRLNFNKVNIVFRVITLILVISINFYVYIMDVNNKVAIVLLIFSIIIILGMFIYEKLYKSYMEEMFIQLSDMLATIIDMRDEEIFSTTEDTLLSKLQHQTIKLTTILKDKNKQIEKDRNEIKSLISDIAHQLKTPLTNLKMYGEFLQDEDLTEEERREFNDIIIISLDRLSFLIESMIKMSRLESGVIKLKPQINDLNDTLLLAISEVQEKARIKGIEIQLEEVDKVSISHDKNWVREAFFNILENAVKYTSENGLIMVKIQCYEMFTRVDIKDNGVGIKEDELTKIFSRFYRGENSRYIEGIGIGLFLTREIISNQGGYIKVKSSSKGSIFSVFLPR
ncbi:HAMP domain-containing sensor histidine kinase [Clostridium sp.]|uniref:sensor histidine kinase n=1 Tax=Clostridium sp. TaxID=1506 RepID=UPI0025B90A0A|nr:HAMP domain-containing sensor histidine kinase [Clostridium sp.]